MKQIIKENLTASNRETSISLPLAQIESMAFSDLAAGVNTIDSDKMNGAAPVAAAAVADHSS